MQGHFLFDLSVKRGNCGQNVGKESLARATDSLAEPGLRHAISVLAGPFPGRAKEDYITTTVVAASFALLLLL